MPSDDSGFERRIHHRSIDPDADTANIDLVDIVADLEGCDQADLPPLWPRIDDMVADLFSDPPSRESQVRVQFSYVGYRIDVSQTGDIELMKVGGDAGAD